jgi:hypothetical protein
MLFPLPQLSQRHAMYGTVGLMGRHDKKVATSCVGGRKTPHTGRRAIFQSVCSDNDFGECGHFFYLLLTFHRTIGHFAQNFTRRATQTKQKSILESF